VLPCDSNHLLYLVFTIIFLYYGSGRENKVLLKENLHFKLEIHYCLQSAQAYYGG